MDLDFLLDDVMADVIPLDWDAVIRSQLPLKVVASSLTTLRSEVLDSFTDRQDLVECLKASANVPEIVGGPRSHRGHQLVDAAVFEPLPIKAALRCARLQADRATGCCAWRRTVCTLYVHGWLLLCLVQAQWVPHGWFAC
jgi:predicted patatin/cPLA2 family phospholipase